jgi:hypothetical protein
MVVPFVAPGRLMSDRAASSNSRRHKLKNELIQLAGKIQPFPVSEGRDRDQIYPKMGWFQSLQAQFFLVKAKYSMTALRRLSMAL